MKIKIEQWTEQSKVLESAEHHFMTLDTVAEWLRRSTRNRLGLSRVGSSPASVVLLFARNWPFAGSRTGTE
jgi:hypothetical protein